MIRSRSITIVLAVLLSACAPTAVDAPAAAQGSGWRSLAPVPTPRTEVAAAAAKGKIYVIGGFDADGTTARVEVYDVDNNSWTRGPDYPLPVNHATATTLGGEVYVAGGYAGPGSDNPVTRVHVLRDGAWKTLRPLPEPRAAGGLVTLEGRLFAVGGVERDQLADETYMYVPRIDRWRRRPGLPFARQHLGAAKSGGRIYVVGGRTQGLDTNTGRSDRYNPTEREWSRVSAMPTPRGGLAAASALGFVVAAGGEADRTFDEVEAFDIRRRRWRRLPDMPTARHGVGVVTVGSTLYVLAGGPEPGLTYSDANEAFNLQALRGG